MRYPITRTPMRRSANNSNASCISTSINSSAASGYARLSSEFLIVEAETGVGCVSILVAIGRIAPNVRRRQG